MLKKQKLLVDRVGITSNHGSLSCKILLCCRFFKNTFTDKYGRKNTAISQIASNLRKRYVESILFQEDLIKINILVNLHLKLKSENEK